MKQVKFKDLKDGDYFLYYYLNNYYYQVNKLINKSDDDYSHKCKVITGNWKYLIFNRVGVFHFNNNDIAYKLDDYEVRGLMI
jgi:hypothetical protein